MLLTTRSGREVEVTEIDGEIGAGAYVMAATYIDDDTDVDDDTCVELSDDNAEVLYEEHIQNMIGSAEAAFEGDR